MAFRKNRIGLAGGVAVLTWLALPQAAWAQPSYSWGPSAPVAPLEVRERYDPNARYDGIDAGEEAYQLADQGRRDAIDRQLQAIQDARWYAGLPTGSAYYRNPPSLGIIYAGPRRLLPWRARRAERRGGYGYVYSYPYAFEPWPLVGGDIFGYPYDNPIRQPSGVERIWTSPNRYLSRPIYGPAEPVLPPPIPQGAPEPVPPPPPEPAPPPASPPLLRGPVEF